MNVVISGAVISGSLACIMYLLSAAVQMTSLREEVNSKRSIVIVTAIIAIILHGIFTYQEIYTPAGINIGIYPMASLTSLAIATIVVASSLRRPVGNLLIILLPFATLTVLLSLLQEGSYAPRTDITDGIFVHIALSVVAYSLLAIAAFQAALLSLGDYELKHRNLAVLRRMPPLQTMESLLFELIWVGLIFLSLSILTGFTFFGDSDGGRAGLIHHTIITLTAWVVFAVLLWGRYRLGWRGSLASRWTLAGFGLLLIGYFGSKLVLELVLGRV
ncbi:MAG TPA: hypothetical protein EYQ14_14705 [Gammaproteobacteria bacterium]|nr:hypothetical protein [Gammaproteobacteria bacterium]